MLIRFLQFGDRRLVISRIEGNVARQIRVELHLVGIIGLVESRPSGLHVLLSFVGVSSTGSHARLSALPAEEPKIFVSLGEIGLTRSRVVAHLVPLVSVIGIAQLKVDAGEFIAGFCCGDGIPLRQPCIEDLHLRLGGLEGVPLERVRECQRAQRLLLGICRSHINGLGEVFLCLCVFALQIESNARFQMRLIEIRRLLECLPVKGESIVLIAVMTQFFSALHQIRSAAWSGRWSRRSLLRAAEYRRRHQKNGRSKNRETHPSLQICVSDYAMNQSRERAPESICEGASRRRRTRRTALISLRSW